MQFYFTKTQDQRPLEPFFFLIRDAESSKMLYPIFFCFPRTDYTFKVRLNLVHFLLYSSGNRKVCQSIVGFFHIYWWWTRRPSEVLSRQKPHHKFGLSVGFHLVISCLQHLKNESFKARKCIIKVTRTLKPHTHKKILNNNGMKRLTMNYYC